MQKPKKKTLSQMWDDEYERIKKFKGKGIEEGIIYITKEPPKPQEVTQKDIEELRRITPETSRSVRYRSADAIDLYTPSNAITLETGGASSVGTVDAGVGIRHGRLPTKSDEEKEYTELKNRLKRRVEGAEKRGYIFDDTIKDILDSEYSDLRLSQIREILDPKHRENLYKAAYKETDSGEFVSGVDAFNQEISKGLREYHQEHYVKYSDIMENRINLAMQNAGDLAPLIKSKINEAIDTNGRNKTYNILYRDEKFRSFLDFMITYAGSNIAELNRAYDYLVNVLEGARNPAEEGRSFNEHMDDFYVFVGSPEYQQYLAELEGLTGYEE